MRGDFVSRRVRAAPQGSYGRAPSSVAAAVGWRRLGERALAAVLASPCLGCGGALGWAESPLLLCEGCERALRAPAEPGCRACGRPLDGALGAGATRDDLLCGA